MRMWNKFLGIMLSLCMVLTTFYFVPEKTVKANEPSEQVEEKNTDDYENQYFTDLLDEEEITVSDDTITVQEDEKSEGVVFTGNLKDAVITVDKTFNFDRASVCRISIDALAAKSVKAELAVYLDDNTEPIATVSLYRQKKKNNWTYSKNISIDVADLKLTGEHTISFKVASISSSDTSIMIRSIEFVESSVPVVYFNIDESEGTIAEMNASDDHSVECYGTMTVQIPDGYEAEYSSKALKTETYDMEYIRGRGNSTWSPDKKPYKVKLDKKQDVLGMGKNKHWVLLANYYDNSLLRNKITYWLGAQLNMEFTPRSVPVDVIMNGEYLGSYFLCEQIRVGKTRVDIDDLEDNDEVKQSTDPEIISGGYLMGMSPYGEDEDEVTFETNRGLSFELENPSFEDYENETQLNYIKNYMQQVEDAIYGEDYKDQNGISYKDLMDVRSTVYYYWMQEFSMNGDAFGSPSTYLYKKRNGKLYWGPLWDFDYVAWGSTEYLENNTTGWTQNESAWYGRLFTDKTFAQEVVDAWPSVKDKMEELIAPGGQLDTYASQMKITAKYNFEKWGMSELGWEFDEEDKESDPLTYDEEIERLRGWIRERINWVDRNVDSLVPVECTVQFKADGKLIATQTEYVGKTIQKMPQAPEKKGYEFSGWEVSYHMTFEEYLKYMDLTEEDLKYEFDEEEIKDLKKNGYNYEGEFGRYDQIPKSITLTAVYIPEDEVVKAKSIILSKNNINCPMWCEDFELEAQVIPFDTTNTFFTWTTSNEAVATVRDGMVHINGAGEADITVETNNGKKASCHVHAFTEKELEDKNIWDFYSYLKETEITMKVGEYKRLEIAYSTDEPFDYYQYPYFQSLDYEVVGVGSAGVLYAESAGTTTVYGFNNDNDLMICRVTVVDPKKVSVGEQYTVNGLKYQILSNKGKNRTVACIGASKKDIKKVKIPKTVTIKNKKFKVKEISDKAFYGYKKLQTATISNGVEFIGKSAFGNCKKLKKVTIGKSVQVIYEKAFASDKKLKNIVIKAANAKINKNAFKGTAKKAKFKVPKKSREYYKLVLKNKNIK